MSGELITSKELSKRMGLSHSYTKQLLREGKILGALKVGRRWLISTGIKPVKAQKLPTAKTAAKRLGFSSSHMRRLLREGKIEATKIGGDWVITNLNKKEYRRQRKAKLAHKK